MVLTKLIAFNPAPMPNSQIPPLNPVFGDAPPVYDDDNPKDRSPDERAIGRAVSEVVRRNQVFPQDQATQKIDKMIENTRKRLDSIAKNTELSRPTIRRLEARLEELAHYKSEIDAGRIQLMGVLGWENGCEGPLTRRSGFSQFHGLVYKDEQNKTVYRELGTSVKLAYNSEGQEIEPKDYGKAADEQIGKPGYYLVNANRNQGQNIPSSVYNSRVYEVRTVQKNVQPQNGAPIRQISHEIQFARYETGVLGNRWMSVTQLDRIRLVAMRLTLTHAADQSTPDMRERWANAVIARLEAAGIARRVSTDFDSESNNHQTHLSMVVEWTDYEPGVNLGDRLGQVNGIQLGMHLSSDSTVSGGNLFSVENVYAMTRVTDDQLPALNPLLQQQSALKIRFASSLNGKRQQLNAQLPAEDQIHYIFASDQTPHTARLQQLAQQNGLRVMLGQQQDDDTQSVQDMPAVIPANGGHLNLEDESDDDEDHV